MQAGSDADLLVIATGQDNSGVSKLAASMPVSIADGGLHVQDTRGFFNTFHHAWWKLRTSDELPSGELGTVGMPDALVEEIESPYRERSHGGADRHEERGRTSIR